MKATDLFGVEVFPKRLRKIDYLQDFTPYTLSNPDSDGIVSVPISVPLKEAEAKAEELLQYCINEPRVPVARTIGQAYRMLKVRDGDVVVRYRSGLFKNPRHNFVMPKSGNRCGLACINEDSHVRLRPISRLK